MSLKSVVITGASSGIGKEMAIEFASRGYALGLTARRYDLLKEIQKEVEKLWGKAIPVELRVLDVTIYRDVFRVIKELDYALGGMDILVVNAGMGKAKPLGTGNFQGDRQVIETNLLGAMASVDAGIEVFRQSKKQGMIVGISSIAGTRGFPGNAAYSASKAGFTNYLEAAKLEVEGEGILVSTVLPGFIDTPMTQNLKSKPFSIDSKTAAIKICNSIERRKKFVIIPFFPWYFVHKLLKWIPNFLFGRFKKSFERNSKN
ncbi:MAG: SDR family NAD(P)-dependent oxidoreductase [Leptospiraceae bacterium]|nr:SDR family NAD(P)-dependent oxidoreductase [Leptospiraceae bacterium]MCP5510985.1 SDR family NAD(P)-dependent oxidoreductase [Leptospiraceae bacterium]